MADHSILMPNILTTPLIWTKLTIALAIIASPIMVQAALANMGSFRITSQNLNNGTVSGRYTAFGSATGTTSYVASRLLTSGLTAIIVALLLHAY